MNPWSPWRGAIVGSHRLKANEEQSSVSLLAAFASLPDSLRPRFQINERNHMDGSPVNLNSGRQLDNMNFPPRVVHCQVASANASAQCGINNVNEPLKKVSDFTIQAILSPSPPRGGCKPSCHQIEEGTLHSCSTLLPSRHLVLIL